MTDLDQVTGTVQFIQHHVPPLEAGSYTLQVDVSLSATQQVDGKRDTAGDTAKHRFAVYGERFALDPAQIDSVFPPPNASGEFDRVLPHVVLTRRTLPWERTPNTSGDGDPPTGDVASWLALLTFDETELVRVRQASATVASLAPADAVTGGTLPPKTVSSLTAGVLDDWEHLADPCTTIDVPADLFSAVAPSLADLKWLAHARRKTIPGAAPTDPDVVTDYAVVIGNRLPQAGHTSTVVLVSLEQLGDYLPDEDGHPAGTLGDVTVRLVAFTSWKITAVAEPLTFRQLLEGLDGAHPEDDAVLRLAPNEPLDASRASAAIERGYVALAHTTRAGDETISWYRGPLAPYAVAPSAAAAALPVDSADAIAAYDPATGMFDVSYAAAWQAGRLLGLADRRFATELSAFRRGLRRATATLLAGGRRTRDQVLDAVRDVLG